MKKIIAILLAMAMIFTLAACAAEPKPSESSKPTEPSKPAYDAEAVIKGFTTTPTKISATFKQTYILEVQNPDYVAFAKDVADEVVVNVDLTSGNVYYYGKLTEKDGKVSEQLVCKEGDGYICLTTSAAKQSLASEAEAVEVIGAMMKSLSLKTAGYIDLGFFTFNNTSWIANYVLLGSTNVKPDDAYFAYTYSDNNGGIKMEMNADYIGYFGDQGTFEFGKQKEAQHAGIVKVETTKEGFVTSFSEKLTAYQELAIINPPVPLVLNGERTMTATYNGEITRVDSIKQNGMIVMPVENAKVSTYDFDVATNVPTPSTEVAPGHFVAVKVEPKSDYEVKSVTVNGTDTQLMGGFYCLMTPAQEGTVYVISIELEKESQGEQPETPATIVLGNLGGTTVKTFDFDYATMSFTEGTTVAPGHFVAFQIQAPEGVTVTPSVNGDEVTFIGGYYCYMTAVTAGKTYTIDIAVKASQGGQTTQNATIVLGNLGGTTVKTFDFDYATMAFTEGTTVEPNHYVAFQIQAPEGATVTPTVNGEEVQFIGGYYCYMTAVTAGKTYTIDVDVKLPQNEPENKNATIVLGNLGGTTVKTFDFDYGSFKFVEGTTVAPGHFVAFQIQAPEGATVTPTVNGEEVQFFNGYYCYMTAVSAGETYTIDVDVKLPQSAQNATIILGNLSGTTVKTFDFDYGSFKFVEGTTVAPGHFVAFQVEAPEGVTVTPSVNGDEVTFIGGYYCYMTAVTAGETYTIDITVK